MLHPRFAEEYPGLIRKFDLVHTANLLHLFDVEAQAIFFHNLVPLAKPGSVIFGRQVGLAPGYPAEYKQPDGKGYRFTVVEFRDWCSRITGWQTDATEFEGQLVQYDDLRAKREDKKWALQ